MAPFVIIGVISANHTLPAIYKAVVCFGPCEVVSMWARVNGIIMVVNSPMKGGRYRSLCCIFTGIVLVLRLIGKLRLTGGLRLPVALILMVSCEV